LSPNQADGFSLVEILVALAIVGLTLGTAAAVFRSGIVGHVASADVDTAVAVAEETIASAGVTAALREGDTHGLFADRFAWRLSVRPYEDGAQPPPDRFKLYRLEVEVSWRDGLRQRRIELATMRLAPAP
jgi:general secretion pathway protein I